MSDNIDIPQVLGLPGSNPQTPLQNVLSKIPAIDPLTIRDTHCTIKEFGAAEKQRRPVSLFEVLHVLRAVAKGELKPSDFELWSYSQGVFEVLPDGNCPKLSEWKGLGGVAKIMNELQTIWKKQSQWND